MPQLKNTTDREWTIAGRHKFAPGASLPIGTGPGEVPPVIAREYKNDCGWEIIEEEKNIKKDKKEKGTEA